jgi:hypothetical protein
MAGVVEFLGTRGYPPALIEQEIRPTPEWQGETVTGFLYNEEQECRKDIDRHRRALYQERARLLSDPQSQRKQKIDQFWMEANERQILALKRMEKDYRSGDVSPVKKYLLEAEQDCLRWVKEDLELQRYQT